MKFWIYEKEKTSDISMIYSPKKLDPRSKLAITLSFILAGLFPSSPIILLILIGLFILLVSMGKDFSQLLGYISPFRFLIPILFILNLFFYAGGEKLWGINLLGLNINLTSQGLKISSLIILRLTLLAASSAWFAVNTAVEEFEITLSKMGIPWKLSFILSLTLRLVPDIRNQFKRIEDSHRARGVKLTGGPLIRIKSRIPILIPFLAGIIRAGYEVAEALKVRNFGAQKKRTYYLELSYRRADYLLYLFALIVQAVFWWLKLATPY